MIKNSKIAKINFTEIKNLNELATAFEITKEELDKRFVYSMTNEYGNVDVQFETLTENNEDDFVVVEVAFDEDNNFISAKLITDIN